MIEPTTLSTPDISQLIKKIRESRKLTQEQLARKLDVTFGTVNSWERGKHRPGPAMAKRLLRLAKNSGINPETEERASGSLASGEIDSIPVGWPRADSERRDFLHRPREFPDEVVNWRNTLVAEAPSDIRFPLISPEDTREEIRARLDLEISRLREIDGILHILHGSPTLGNQRDPVDELVYIILSRKTPEAQYQAAFAALKRKYRTWDGVLRARTETLEKLVSGAGLATKKARAIRGALEAIKKEFGKISLEAASDWSDAELEKFLCALPEVSRKSAYCVMMYSCGRKVFPVDAHVGRILSRLSIHSNFGLDLDGLDHKQLTAVLADLVPPNLRASLHVNLVAHGRKVCTAKSPDCDNCDIVRFCATFRGKRANTAAEAEGPTVIDMFCGAGGLTEGFHNAGFRTLLGLDNNEVALRTYALNHDTVPADAVLSGDIREISGKDLRKLIGRRRLDVLAGAPPCQGFSSVGNRSKRSKLGKGVQEDGRNFLYEEFVRLAAELKPRLVLFENVPGMGSAKMQKKSFVELACKLLKDAGYTTAVWKLDASLFGVPQLRSRIFVIGSESGTLPAKPVGNYANPRGENYDRYAPRPIALGHAIFDLPKLEAGMGEGITGWSDEAFDERRGRRFLTKYKMRNSPRILFNHTVRYHNERDLELYGLLGQGENSTHIVERGRRDLMRYRTDVFDDKYMRLDEEIPCKTIVSHLAKDGNGYVHPTQTRSISFREAARVQTFPDDFAFCGSPSDQWTQLGNAVPPLLAEAIGRSIKTYLERNRK